MAFAWFGGSAPFSAVAGFLFGGIFALSWSPWIYWSQSFALIVLTMFASWSIPNLPAQPVQKRSLRERVQALDVPGGLTGVSSLVLFNFAWNQAVAFSWRRPHIYVCLIISIRFGVAFLYIEMYKAKYPILPLSAFNSDIAFVFACAATGWACFCIWVRPSFFYTQQMLSS